VGEETSIPIAGEAHRWLEKEGYKFYYTGKREWPLVLKRNGKFAGFVMPIKGGEVSIDILRKARLLQKAEEYEKERAKKLKPTAKPEVLKELPPQVVKFKIGSRSFVDTSSPSTISSIERFVRSQVQDSVSRTKTVLSSILNNEPRFQKYFGDLDDLSSILISVYRKVPTNVKEFIDLVRRKTGVPVMAVDVKKVESAVEKLLRKQAQGKWKIASEVNNILRGTIIAKDENEARSFLRKLKELLRKCLIKN